MLVTRYEDLKQDTLSQVIRMLDFLNWNYSWSELAVKLRDGFNIFRRNHTDTDKSEYYTREQRLKVNGVIKETASHLENFQQDHLFKLHDYLFDEGHRQTREPLHTS